MGNGLAARARGVQVSGLVGADDCESGGGETFGRDVDVGAMEGSSGGEEDGLSEGPVFEIGGDGRVEGWHFDFADCFRVRVKLSRRANE